MPATRRVVMFQLVGTAAAATWPQVAPASLDPLDPQAVPLGYIGEASQVDARRFPHRTAEQVCANCQVYAGKPGEPSGPCAVFPGRLVSARGWCSAWVLKAA